MFEKEPDYYYSVDLLGSNSTCHLKVSNVVPPSLSSRRPSPRVYKSEADYQLAAQKTDQLLLAQERQRRRRSTLRRSSQMESEESFFPAIISPLHVRQVYSGIRVLEHRIVCSLLSHAVGSLLLCTPSLRWHGELAGETRQKEEIAKEKIRSRLRQNDMPVQESFVNATYWRNVERWQRMLHKLYEGLSFYSDEDSFVMVAFLRFQSSRSNQIPLITTIFS